MSVFQLIRPDDLLNLRIETDNLRLVPGESPELIVDDPARRALLRVIFPPQHIAEQAVFETSAIPPENDPNRPEPDPVVETLPQPGAYGCRMAQPSRLVFEVPTGHHIPFTVAGLLDWRALIPQLHPLAAMGASPSAEARAAAPPPSAPLDSHTALELPYRLLISPDQDAVWVHRLDADRRFGRSELWHTRLALRGQGESTVEIDTATTVPLRALWSTDPPGDQANPSITPGIGLTALSPDDRRQIVSLTSAFHGYESNPARIKPSALKPSADIKFKVGWQTFRIIWSPHPYEPKPFNASQLMLSSLGGWLKSRGNWDPPRPATPARNLGFAELVQKSAFASLFARAPSRTIVEPQHDQLFELLNIKPAAPAVQARALDLSEWVHVATQGRDHYVRVVYEGELWPFRHRAALVKVTERKFRLDDASGIVVACLIQRVFIIVREPLKTLHGRGIPLTQVHLTTVVTPDLAMPRVDLSKFKRTFWVELGAAGHEQVFQFHASGIDQAGRAVDFMVPLVFASITDVSDKLADVAAFYNGTAPFAMPPTDRRAAFFGRKLAFTELRDGSENPLLATEAVLFAADASGASPTLDEAQVRIPALAELLGKNDAIAIQYDGTYVANGYADPANTTGVFATLNPPLQLDFHASQAGGIATPNQRISALSLKQGPVAGTLARAKADDFQPTDYFPANLPTLPKLFGTFGLDSLLEGGSLSAQAPKISTQRLADKLVTTLDWQPLMRDSLSVGVAVFRKSEPRTLVIKAVTETPLGSAPPSSEFSGEIGAFTITLLDSVMIQCTRFVFVSRNGETPSVEVELDTNEPLVFSGDLQFVDDLRHAIPPGLFGKGASLEVTGAAIRAGFAIALPPLEIGVFALKDVSLGAGLTLPFLDGKPILDFNVSERANPFQLRVAFFAGGGFFHLQMDTAGMRQLEAALEFGAAFGLNLGVASGEVHAMAGIYFAIQRIGSGVGSKDICQLTGYLRLGGRLSVLALIRVSIEFNLSFTYNGATGKAYGRATLTVMVEVLLFSASVDLTVERAFGGAGDPLFIQTFDTAQRWHDYASAYA